MNCNVKAGGIKMIEKREFYLHGLGCASCAAKMEARIKNLPEVVRVAVSFATSSLLLEAEQEALERLVAEAGRIIKEIEPQVVLVEKGVKDADDREEQKRTGGLQGGVSLLIPWKEMLPFGLGLLFYLGALLSLAPAGWGVYLYILAYLMIGGPIVFAALQNMTRGQLFDENFLMVLATMGAFAIGEYPEAVAVMVFFRIGEFFQDRAVDRSRRSISALLDIRPDYADIWREGSIVREKPESVQPGEVMVIKAGERIPLDGLILEGLSQVDTSALTGEAVPRRVQPGDEVLAGFVNTTGVLRVSVTRPYEESAVAKILDLVENASARKAPTESFITKFARYYTPGVVILAAGLAFLPPLFLPGASTGEWLYRGLIFLVVSCPCALVVSIPLGFFGGIGGASRNGILMKGGNYLEGLNQVDTVVFDKTGTLTRGVFEVTDLRPAGSFTRHSLLEYAALAESYSNHPIAKSILEAWGKPFDRADIESYEEKPGLGIVLRKQGKTILAGSDRLLEANGLAVAGMDSAGSSACTRVHVAVAGEYAGLIVVSDQIRPDAPKTMKALKEAGIKRLVMLTGDNEESARRVAGELGIDRYYAGLLPQDKVRIVEELSAGERKGKLVYMGDGINDAPVLARSDIGVAMGGLGSDAAIEAADVVLMSDEPSKLVTAFKIARRTKTIVWQNIFFSLGIKGIVLLLAAAGTATMWEAVFADVGVALLAVLNAMRVLRPVERTLTSV